MSKTNTKPYDVTIYHATTNWSFVWQGTNLEGQPHRYRETFSVNYLKDLLHRGQRANLIHHVLSNWAITEGYPLTPTRWDGLLNYTAKDWGLCEAVAYAVNLKVLNSSRTRTHETFQMYGRIFVEHFLVEMGWLGKKLSEFGRKDAQIFLDWLTEGGAKRSNDVHKRDGELSGQTVKNYRSGLRSLFSELVERELILVNPWSGTKSVKAEEAIRRPMTKEEQTIVFSALYAANPFLLLGVLFQYHCAIRPGEMRRLKFKMIDLNAGLIHMPPDVTKNHDRGAVTIPREFVEILEAFSVRTFPPDWFIFGYHLNPHPTIQMGEKTLSNSHRIILKGLKETGQLANIDGLQFYSWKDNCGMEMVDYGIDINNIRLHFRHKSLDYTQRYLNRQKGVIASIQNKTSDLADVGLVKERILDWNNKKFKNN